MASKTTQFNIRAPSADVKEWERRAKESGMARGEWVRRALNIGPVFETRPVEAKR